jgi:hypothetical protein
MATRFGLCNSLRSLLASKDGISMDINQRTEIYTTAIILAASGGQVEAIQILLDHDAEPMLEN